MIKKDKIGDFLMRNSVYAGMLNTGYKINDIDVDKDSIFQDEIFNPVIVLYSNSISQILFKKNIFNVSIIKDSQSLCFISFDEEESEDDSGEDPFLNSMASLIVMDVIREIFINKYSNGLNLIELVTAFREEISWLPKGSKIDSLDLYKKVKGRIKNKLENEEKLKNKI